MDIVYFDFNNIFVRKGNSRYPVPNYPPKKRMTVKIQLKKEIVAYPCQGSELPRYSKRRDVQVEILPSWQPAFT